MKIWHYSILPQLPTQLLTALHRDCCALRGCSWGKATTTELKWLWNHTLGALEFYHLLVMDEMQGRGWNPNPDWREGGYRGKKAPRMPPEWEMIPDNWPEGVMFTEFNSNYLQRDHVALVAWKKDHPDVVK